MATCQVCEGPANNAFLCHGHARELREMFKALAGHISGGRQVVGWIETLADCAHGQSKMGGSQTARNVGGDDSPIRFNDKASRLLLQLRGTLARWVLDLTEERGATYRPMRYVRLDFIGPLRMEQVRGPRYLANGAELALWLQIHHSAVVLSEDAGQCFKEVSDVIAAIKRIVDRPPVMRDLGECPVVLDDGERCAHFLRGERGVDEVTCPACESVLKAEDVLEESLSRADHMPWTSEMIMTIVEQYGLKLSARTWRDWRQMSVVKPCLYQRVDGRIGIGKNADTDVPLYRLSDVREALATKGKPGKREKAA